jgi:hypothetical protein
MARPALPIVRPPHSMALRAPVGPLVRAQGAPASPCPSSTASRNQGAISKLPSMATPSPWQARASPKPRRSALWPWTPCSSSLCPTTPRAPLHLPGAGNSQMQAPRTPMAASLSIAAELPYFPSHGAELHLPISLRTCSIGERR